MNRMFGMCIFVTLLLLAVTPVFAESEPTPEATAVVTGPVVVNVEQPAAPPVDTNALAEFGLYALLTLIGGGSFALVLTRLDKRGLDALEKAYQSTPPEVQATILEVVKTLTEVVRVGQIVTDGKPNDTPPTGL